MSTIIAIDPGPMQSAWVRLNYAGVPTGHGKTFNFGVLHSVAHHFDVVGTLLVVEGMQSMGMAVGQEVFEAVFWAGRFFQGWIDRGGIAKIIYRKEVKMFHCDTVRANDSNIRAALIDRFGGKEKAIGRKASPGPLYGISADRWSALALAITAQEAAK